MLSYTTLEGQKLLFHRNRNDEVIYTIGDKISFNLNGSRKKISGKIVGFQDSLIVFGTFSVNPKNISHVYLDSKTRNWYFLKYKYSKLFLIAGVWYLLLDRVNSGKPDTETLVVGTTLIGAGLLAKVLISERIPVRGRHRLMILH
jgi:hypothetical protein